MAFEPTGRVYAKQTRKGRIWYVIINQQKDESGKYPQKFINTHLPDRGNKKEALKILDEELQKYKNELIEKERLKNNQAYGIVATDSNAITFIDYLKNYLNEKKSSLRPVTYQGYIWVINKIEKYFSKIKFQPKLSEVSHHLINQMYKSFQADKLKVKTIDNVANLIRPALKDAYINDIIPFNPYDKVTKLKKQPEIDVEPDKPYLNDEQMKQFIKNASKDYLGRLFVVCLMSGLRRSELLGLRWSNIDLDKKTLSISGNVQKLNKEFIFSEINKTEKSTNDQIMCDVLFEMLSKIKEEQQNNKKLWGNAYIKEFEDFVCVNPIGQLYNPDFFTKQIKKYIPKDSGMPNIHLHSLRHSFCTFMYNNTHDIYLTMNLMRHTRIETTKGYTHADKEDEYKKRGASVLQNIFGDLELSNQNNVDNQEETKNDKKWQNCKNIEHFQDIFVKMVKFSPNLESAVAQ